MLVSAHDARVSSKRHLGIVGNDDVPLPCLQTDATARREAHEGHIRGKGTGVLPRSAGTTLRQASLTQAGASLLSYCTYGD